MENLKNAFVKHINSIPFYGAAIICGDNKTVGEIIPQITRRYITYGFGLRCDVRAVNIKISSGNTSFDVIYMGKKIGNVLMKIPGEHNILNSLAAITAGLYLGIPFNHISKAVKNFDGVGRRLEIKGEKNGITIIDDYGHHPTEIAATVKAVKKFWNKRKLWVLFQPHRYTRTKNLYKEFGKSFTEADCVRVMDIYAAGEKEIEGVNSELIIDSLKKNGCNVEKFKDIKSFAKELTSQDIVLTLGAGDVWKKGEELLTLI